MPRVRKNIWTLNQPWDDTLLWYAKAVGELKKRPISNLTSWLSLGAMHGFDENYWISLNLLPAGSTLPTAAQQKRYWKQCQHQSWFFLPWHRGYLASFERIIAATIVELGGPSDWALPYWNYNDNSTRNIPQAFAERFLPGPGNIPNPLFEPRRFGTDGHGNVTLPPTAPGNLMNLEALRRTKFEAASSTGSPGFGGPATPFHHDSQDGPSISGGIERMPHNFVHGQIGGDGGLMSDPDTAALDAIFWIHHANIDRLWEVWRNRDSSFINPTDSNWLNGPIGRPFAALKADGTDWPFTSADMVDTKSANLDYEYDDTSDPLAGSNRLALRLERLEVAGPSPQDLLREALNMPKQETELVGGNSGQVKVGTSPIESTVTLDTQMKDKVLESLNTNFALDRTTSEPDRLFLNLQNIRATNDSAAFSVYVDLPAGADPAEHPDRLAGTVSLFGARKASASDGPNAGNGLNESLEITEIVDRLHLAGKLDATKLNVRIVPVANIKPGDDISIGSINVYRQGK